MARPGWPERNKVTRSLRQLRRFLHVINSDKVFGTHNGFSKALGHELGPFGITANTVVPGAIDTEQDWSQYPKTTRKTKEEVIPVRRWGHVDDLAYARLYLCTTGSFMNGQALHLKGGEYMF